MSKGIKKEPFLVLIASFLTYLFTDSNKCFSYTFILRNRESRDKGIQMGIQALMEWTILYIYIIQRLAGCSSIVFGLWRQYILLLKMCHLNPGF